MILKEKKFRITKITKNGNFWNLFPKGCDEPVCLDTNLVYGKLPPRWKWPWQYHDLTIKTVADKFTVYAEMDGVVLFAIPEENYSEETKREIRRIEKIESDYVAFQQQYTDSINAQLHDFLPKIPEVPELEEEINKLPVCWRAYLKMHLPMQYESKENQQRLFLTYHLIRIADRLYRRHTDLDAPLSVAFRSVEFSIRDRLSDSLTDGMVELVEKTPQFRNSQAFILFNEAKAELERVLPPTEQPLNLYLIQVIHHLLSSYSVDYANMVCKRPRDVWGDTVNTDNEAYRYLCEEMNLPKLSTLIIEKSFSNQEIANFNFVF